MLVRNKPGTQRFDPLVGDYNKSIYKALIIDVLGVMFLAAPGLPKYVF